jgi:hypothetical protein
VFNWNVGQLVLLKESADSSTIYVGHVSHVYENRLIVVVVSESRPFLPRILRIKNRVWESVIRDSDIEQELVIIKSFNVDIWEFI